MHIRILDLDGSVVHQRELIGDCRIAYHPARDWGPVIRMGCSFGRFRQLEQALEGWLAPATEAPNIIFYGSGDFHHVSLALLRRLTDPLNLLVLDNHPDWMQGIPFLHCGTWLYHAARLPQVRRVFHAGGEVDFDNFYRWLAPWDLLHSEKIKVFPACRRFQKGAWSRVAHESLRLEARTVATADRIEELLQPFHSELARWPLYISLDKDVLCQADALVNWDSGHLSLAEACAVLGAFVRCAGGRLAGMDIAGDWSAVVRRGLLRHVLHWTEHPRGDVDPAEATRRNQHTNEIILDCILGEIAKSHRARQPRQAAG